MSAPFGEICLRLANAALVAAYAAREIEILQTSDLDDARAQAAATALAALHPERLQAFLAANPEGIQAVIGHINADLGATWSPALGALIERTALIRPPTPESLTLFTDAIAQIGENERSRSAAAAFFSTHGAEVLRLLQGPSGSLGLPGQEMLSNLFARLLFTEPAYTGQVQFRAALVSRLQHLAQALENHANENPDSPDAEAAARLLGSLVGTIESGFQVAVDELEQRNQGVEGMVHLILGVVGQLPAGPLGRALSGLDAAGIEDWVVERLGEQPEDARAAIPFHEFVGEGIQSLRDSYDAARQDVFVNRALSLTR